MTTADRIKQGYERLPYPGIELGPLIKKGGSLPPLKWMLALGRPGQASPTRILVAGCGTGIEAFILRQRLPKAEIVAADFSPRSITEARRLQHNARPARPITFLVADLTDASLAAKTGGNFDLITCHGVLSYIPNPGLALKHLGACLRPGGALYLGVNGAAHPATTLRPWLAEFGLDVDEMKNESRLRELLGLWDSLHDEGGGELATMSASYLASDICGSHFNNWSLAHWRTEANRSGWEIAGTDVLPMALRLTMERKNHRLLFPAGSGEVAARLDQARPAGFHRMLLRRAKKGGLDLRFDDQTRPRLRWTGLYSARVIQSHVRGTVSVLLTCALFHLRLEWTLTRTQANALLALTKTSVAQKAGLRPWAETKKGRELLWLWAGLGVVALDD